jgi:hypothetical protein
LALPAPSVQGDTVAAANRPSRVRPPRRKGVAAGQMALPIAAATATPDYQQIQQDWDTTRTNLLEQWPDAADALVTELSDSAAAAVAEGDLASLGSLFADAATVAAITALLSTAMAALADAATVLAAAEVTALGLTAPSAADASTRINGLAAVFAGQIVAGYAQSASRKAILLAGDELTLAELIRAHLEGIGAAASGLVGDSVSAALTAAQNTGRAAILSQLTGVVWVADEHMDRAACLPCKSANGTEYETWAEAEAHYPVVGNSACLGGGRCRGQLRIALTP